MAAPVRTILRGPSSLSSLRRLTIFSPAKAQIQPVTQPAAEHIPHADVPIPPPSAARHNDLSKTYFDGTDVLWVGLGGDKPPDPNKTKLGKSEFCLVMACSAKATALTLHLQP